MSKEKLAVRCVEGELIPADTFCEKRLKERGYLPTDLLFVDITKPRNPGFHRLVHAFGEMVAENVEAFENVPAHDVLKRIQIEGNIGCDEVALNFPGIGPCTYRVPRSLSYASMDQVQFSEVYGQMCEYIRKTYYPELDQGAVERLVELMPDA
jgi:hypothetical protein